MSIWVNILYPWLESRDQNHYIKKKKAQFLTNSILKYEIKKRKPILKKSVNPRINIGLKAMKPWRVMKIQNEKKWINDKNNNKDDV